jgi:hypothetical protein
MTMSRPPRPQLLMLLPIFLVALSSLPLKSAVTAHDSTSSSYHIPIRYKVNQKQTECLYDKFEQGEQVTFSVFVVEALLNGKPKCNVMYEGPLTTQTLDDSNNNNNDGSGRRLTSLGRMIRQALLNEWNENKKDTTKSFNQRIRVDWTHAGEEEDKVLIREEIHSQNRKQSANTNNNNNPHHKPISTVAKSKIEPFEITHTIPVSGYYRVCAQAELQALIVEMDARSSTRMGGIDVETGHVYTYAKRDLRIEEAAIDNKNGQKQQQQQQQQQQQLDSNTYQSEMEELSKLLLNQVEASDLRRTREQIKDLNSKTSDIMTEIQHRMTRIRSHEQSARRNSANLVWSSKVETLLFAVISGFQVYTMRKWLLSNTLLGR